MFTNTDATPRPESGLLGLLPHTFTLIAVTTLVGLTGCSDDPRPVTGVTDAADARVDEPRSDAGSAADNDSEHDDPRPDFGSTEDEAGSTGGTKPEVVLDRLLAFPSAFGAAQGISGGRGGEVYEVTNLNNSGPGSYRDAISKSDRIIIIKVEGLVDISSEVIRQVGSDNLTIWGQFAPGRGITISGNRHELHDSNNHVIRHVTMQNKFADGFGSFGFTTTEQEGAHTNPTGEGHYVDHCSFRYGMDQIFDISTRLSNEKTTAAYNLIAEAVEGHNTGGIIGGGSTASRPSGDITFARNMFYNVHHRHPNMGGNGGRIEHYNNYIVNWDSRMTRVNGALAIDWFRNYADAGNHSKGSVAPVNKYFYSALQWDGKTPSIYSAHNFVGGWDEEPALDQQSLWVWYKSSPGGCTGGCDTVGVTEVIENTPVDPGMFAAERQHDFPAPPDGFWDAPEVPEKLRASVGHSRGVNADGSPGFFRDNVDAAYIEKAASGTTESEYRRSSQWNDPSFTGTAMYEDSDGDHMPDWFEARHPHLDPAVSDGDDLEVDWDFGTFTVRNTAGYTNLEICAEFYAGGFELLLDGL